MAWFCEEARKRTTEASGLSPPLLPRESVQRNLGLPTEAARTWEPLFWMAQVILVAGRLPDKR